MILNDLKTKVEGSFTKEIVIEDDGGDLVYVFPDTRKFLSIIRRREIKQELTGKGK
ncbi:MAG: hypothetical protein ACXAEX_06875 [Promethearchaeota archaeon]|jgi:hypothetical protein